MYMYIECDKFVCTCNKGFLLHNVCLHIYQSSTSLGKKRPKALIVKIEEIPSEKNRYLILHVYVHILEFFYLEMYSLMILKRKLIFKYHKKA